MSDLNHLVIQGRIAKDASFRTTANGKKVANFTLASNRARKNAAGKYEDSASFFPVSCFVNSDKFAGCLVKGQTVIVEGHLRQDRWEQDDGQKRRQNSIVVSKIHLVFPKKDSSEREESDTSEFEDMVFDGGLPDEDIFMDEEIDEEFE